MGFVIRFGIAQQAARLLSAPQRFLQLAPVRLLRAIVGTKDDAYHRYLTKNGLFALLMKNFQLSLQPPALGGNLFISATLDLLEFIRIENIKVLVDHLCKKHANVLHLYARRFKTLEQLLLKHQQNLEYEAFPPDQHPGGAPAARSEVGRPQRRRSPGRDSDEEAYFESLDDDDESVAQQTNEKDPKDEQHAKDEKDLVEADDSEGSAPTTLKWLLGGYEDVEDNGGLATEDAAALDVSAEAAVDVTAEAAAPEFDVPEAVVPAAAADADGDETVTAAEVEPESECAETPSCGSPGEVQVDEMAKAKGDLTEPSAEEAVAVLAEDADTSKLAESLNHVPKRLKTSASPV